eukprot:gene8582-8764_t
MQLAKTGLVASVPTVTTVHRRSKTLGPKAPRKRTALMVLAKRTSAAELAEVASGDVDAGGSGNNGRGWPFNPCCGGNGGGDDEGQAPGFGHGWNRMAISPQGIAVVMMAMGLYGSMQAGPAKAAPTPSNFDITPATASAAAAARHDEATATVGSADAVKARMLRMSPNYFPKGILVDEEVELICPKQYRVREWVYVH